MALKEEEKMNTRFTIATVCLSAMVFCFFGMTQAAGDNMPSPGQPFQALQDQLNNEVFHSLVPTGVISRSAGSLDDFPDKLLAAKGGKPGKPPGGNGEESDYMVTDLGTLDGGKKSSSAARDINDISDINGNRQVVGWSDDGQQTVATLWTVTAEGDIVDIKPLETLQTSTEAYAINQAGTIVAGHAGTIEYPIPLYWDIPDGFINELTPLGGFSYGVAFDVNDEGKIAGVSTGIEGDPYVYAATLWNENQNVIRLPPLDENGESSRALGINNNGDVVGMSWVWVGEHYLFHAVLWRYVSENEGYEVCDLHVWDYDISHRSSASALTDRQGEIVKIIGERHLFPAGTPLVTVWEMDLSNGCDDYTTQDLGQPAYAADINKLGDVVGQDHSTRSTQPVVWSTKNQIEMDVLPLLKGGSGIAEGISEGGQIVGWSEVRGGRHAVLWTKKQETQ
jgi:probable HAF family extracellular repeat protein